MSSTWLEDVEDPAPDALGEHGSDNDYIEDPDSFDDYEEDEPELEPPSDEVGALPDHVLEDLEEQGTIYPEGQVPKEAPEEDDE